MNPATEERTCPSGHTYLISKFTATIGLNVKDITEAVVFTCPDGVQGHKFTLREAAGSGMFTLKEANKIANAAYREREGHDYKKYSPN